MSRILLINSPYCVRFGGQQGGKYGGAPMGLLSIGTSLKNAGHIVKIIDLHAKPLLEGALKAEIRDLKPDYCGIASMSPNHLAACDLAKIVKSTLDIPIIKGGPHETYCHRTTLQLHPEIDISVVGYGGETIVETVWALENRADLSTVNGISYRLADKVITTTQRAPPTCLDIFPHPDRSLLEPNEFYDFGIFNGKKTAQVRTGLGCFYGCTFCPIDRNYKFHSKGYVVDELRALWAQGYQAIFFDDAIFTANPRLLGKLTEISHSEGLNFEIGGQTRADCNTERPLLENLRKWGVTYLSFGLESGDESILASINKKLNIRDVKGAVSRARGAGIRTALSTMLAFPNESISSVEKTIAALNEIRPDFVSFSIFSVYPGCKIDFNLDWYEHEKYLATDPILRDNFDEGYGAKIAKPISYIRDAWAVILEKLNPEIHH